MVPMLYDWDVIKGRNLTLTEATHPVTAGAPNDVSHASNRCLNNSKLGEMGDVGARRP